MARSTFVFAMAVASAAMVVFARLAVAAPDDPQPQRERDFIAIIEKARSQSDAAKSVDGRRDARLGQQVAMHEFLGLNHYAKDWVGTFARSESTQEGFQSIEIEIGSGSFITTWDSKYDDEALHTMVQPRGRLAAALKSLQVGDQVRFSATLIGSVLSTDSEMVLRPRLIARFDALAKVDEGSAAR